MVYHKEGGCGSTPKSNSEFTTDGSGEELQNWNEACYCEPPRHYSRMANYLSLGVGRVIVKQIY